jgi:neutral amino acid transport system ATP-binding protein
MSPAAADIADSVAGRVGDPILSVRDAWLQFGGLQAVAGASLEVARGSLTALIGPNGAGKTTLFNVITGFYKGDRGAIDYDGHAIFGRQPYDIARLGLVRTFQITKVLSAMPVIDNMMLAAPRQPGESLVQLAIRPAAARRREREIRERALVLLKLFDLRGQAADYAGTLSGGQRKLLELARALMAEPRLVLLDEPMAGVNATLGRRLLEHVEMLRTRDGITFLFIEHDMDVVMRHAGHVVVMAHGRVIADGTPDQVRRDQRVLDAYLGSARSDKP